MDAVVVGGGPGRDHDDLMGVLFAFVVHLFLLCPCTSPPRLFAPAAPPVPECRDPAPPCRAGPRVPPLGSVAGLASSAKVLLSSPTLPA